MRYYQITEKALSPAELRKRGGGRLQTFITKILHGEPFDLATNTDETVVLQNDPDVIAQLKNGEIPSTFVTTDGHVVRLSQLEKTAEFGGKGKNYGLQKENTALGTLKMQLFQLKGDAREIPLRIGNRVVNVADIVKTPGTPKSDFHFVDANGNEVAWVSHKDGKRASHFGQWGGVSEREFGNVYRDHPEIKQEVLDFARAVKAAVGDQIPNRTTVGRRIVNTLLKQMAIYGVDFGKSPGRQNVDVVIQGMAQIENSAVVGSHGTHINGDLHFDPSYDPTLMAIYKGDRGQFGIAGARFSIYPFGGRNINISV